MESETYPGICSENHISFNRDGAWNLLYVFPLVGPQTGAWDMASGHSSCRACIHWRVHLLCRDQDLRLRRVVIRFGYVQTTP